MQIPEAPNVAAPQGLQDDETPGQEPRSPLEVQAPWLYVGNDSKKACCAVYFVLLGEM